MARRKTKRARCLQIARWLADAHPAPYPVKVSFTAVAVDSEGFLASDGDTWRDVRTLHIQLNTRNSWCVMVNVLLHEWAHAAIWPHARIEKNQSHHGSEWGIAFAAVYSSFYERGGDEASCEY